MFEIVKPERLQGVRYRFPRVLVQWIAAQAAAQQCTKSDVVRTVLLAAMADAAPARRPAKEPRHAHD